MADITDPEAIEFSNQRIRPISEDMRALKNRIDSTVTRWFMGMDVTFGTSPNDVLQDERESDSDLTSADVTASMTQMIAYQAQLNEPGVAAVIEKPCVRAV